MKSIQKYIVLSFLTFLFSEVLCQNMPYVFDDSPDLFAHVERLLIEEEADSALISSIIISETAKDPKARGIALFYKAQAEQAVGQFEWAQQSYDEAIKLFESIKFEKGLAMAFAHKGNLFHYRDKPKESLSSYELSISYAKRSEHSSLLKGVYQNMALIYFINNEQDQSLSLLKEALKYSLEEKDDENSINILNQISTNYHSLGNLDSAILYFKKSLELKQEIQDSEGLISDHSALGNLYKERGEHEKAQLHLMEALGIAESTQDTFSIMTVFIETGDIYAAQKIWNIADDYYNKAIKLARLKKNRFVEANCLKKLGNILREQKKDTAAITSYEAALELYAQLKNNRNYAEVLMKLSQLYETNSDFDKLRKQLEKTLLLSKRSPDIMSTLSIKLALAKVEIRSGNYKRGIAYAEECFIAFDKMKDKENKKEASLLLSEGYSKTGDYRKAFQHYKTFSSLKDSIISVERAEAIKKYDLLLTTKKKDEEISRKNEQIQQQEVDLLRKNNQVLLLGGGLGFLALLTVFLLFIYFKNKQLNQQRIQVLQKEQETQRMKAIIEGEEKERKRFSRELHDGLGALLGTVKMQISGVGHKFPQIESAPSYQKAETLIDDACRTVREVSHDLMPYVLEQQGLFPAIEEICSNISAQKNIQINFIPFGDEQKMNDVLKITLYRITQELLKNVVKHAEADEVIVQLSAEEDEIVLIVEDNGKGFDPSGKHKGIGLGNIRSRTAYLNGKLDIESSPDRGSTFTIIIPLKSKT